MKPKAAPTEAQKPKLWEKTRTQNLVRNNASGVYFARFRIGGKLIWRTLDTQALSVAKLRLPDKIEGERKLVAAGDGQITFVQAANIYKERLKSNVTLKERAKDYHLQRLRALLASWPELNETKIRSLTVDDCLKWSSRFSKDYAPSSYNHTLSILRTIIGIGIENGARFDNPAKSATKGHGVQRRSEKPKPLALPEREQFEKFVAEIESSGSGFSKPCAELVRFLAFGGFRKGEAKFITWGDCNFQKLQIKVTGDPETGAKGREAGEFRTVPMIPDMEAMLTKMRAERADEPETEAVMRVNECQKAMDRASKVVGMPRITHHDLRHIFVSTCIESEIDIPTVARWAGHKDVPYIFVSGTLGEETAIESLKQGASDYVLKDRLSRLGLPSAGPWPSRRNEKPGAALKPNCCSGTNSSARSAKTSRI